jgi:ribosomal 50S subunit-recycling heat shock protein
VPAHLIARRGRLAVPLACPKVATCRFTVTIPGVGRASKTVKAGRTATLRMKLSGRRTKVRVTIVRRVDGKPETAKGYARISAPSSRATKAA